MKGSKDEDTHSSIGSLSGILCTPKDCGGVGIQNLEIQNNCLLSKRLFKIMNEEGIWQTLLRRKYLSNKALTQCKKQPGDSHFWSGLMKIKDQFLQCGHFKVRSGTEIRFWEDTWVGDQPLKLAYPNLFRIVRKKSATVVEVLSTTPLSISFRRALIGHNLDAWYSLVAKQPTRAGSREWAGWATAVGPLSCGAQDPECN
jgi:hypothetical protein